MVLNVALLVEDVSLCSGLAVCPPILQLVLLPWCPESPRYLLITKQWEEEARRGERHGTAELNMMANLLSMCTFYLRGTYGDRSGAYRVLVWKEAIWKT